MHIDALWLPILLSAAACWVAGAIIWMVLPHHKSDFSELPDEPGARDALSGIGPGQYNIPHIADPSKMTDDDKARFESGPVGFFTVLPKGMPSMGKNLGLQFLYLLLVSCVVAMVAGAVLPAGSGYARVFHVVGLSAWLGYGFAMIQESIWFGKPWSYTIKVLVDALIYAAITAGLFGWLWPPG